MLTHNGNKFDHKNKIQILKQLFLNIIYLVASLLTGVATPVVDTAAVVDHFFLNTAPFQEEMSLTHGTRHNIFV